MSATAEYNSWLRHGVYLAALVVVGFFGGALFGILWEEPGLLLAHLSGETTEIAWTGEPAAPLERQALAPATAPAPAAPGPAAPAPPVTRTAPQTASAPLATAPPAPEPPPVAAAPPGTLAIQVGAFGSNPSAERLAERLRKAGYPVYVTPGARSDGARWRVRVGPVADRAEAERLSARLKRDEKLPTRILDEDG